MYTRCLQVNHPSHHGGNYNRWDARGDLLKSGHPGGRCRRIRPDLGKQADQFLATSTCIANARVSYSPGGLGYPAGKSVTSSECEAAARSVGLSWTHSRVDMNEQGTYAPKGCFLNGDTLYYFNNATDEGQEMVTLVELTCVGPTTIRSFICDNGWTVTGVTDRAAAPSSLPTRLRFRPPSTRGARLDRRPCNLRRHLRMGHELGHRL